MLKTALPARETDYAGLPPCYTFVMDGEPFYEETLTYVRKLQEAGIEASVDVYHGDVHAFDMFSPRKGQGKVAREKLCEVIARYLAVRQKGNPAGDTDLVYLPALPMP